MAPVSRLLLAALGAALCAGAAAGNLAIPWVAYGLLPSNSQQDPAIVTALPPGMSNLDPAALVYFVRWLQCSSLVQVRRLRCTAHLSSRASDVRSRRQWCTPSEVYSKCTYEPKGTWFRGALFINAPQSWPYCMPQLETIYEHCDFAAKQADSCQIHTIAASLGITLPRQLGNTAAEIAALPPWASAQG